MIVRGRVVDTEGRPVAGAQVFLEHHSVWIPATGRDAPETSAMTDAAGEYVFDMTSEWWFTELHWPAHLRATLGQRASEQVVVRWQEQPIMAPDLVLEAGVTGRVRVAFDDGSPAAGVHLLVILQERPDACGTATGDGEETDCASGETDGNGEMSFGPARDREYAQIGVHAEHPQARSTASWDNRRIGTFDLVLARGREVRGTLRTAEGRPAEGYRVAPCSRRSGDPVEGSAVTTDSLGRFKVAGVDHTQGGIAVYDRLPDLPREGPAALGETEIFARISMRVGRPTNPLLIRDVEDGQEDVGVLVLPEIGTLTIRLEDARRGRPLSGHVFWNQSNGRMHGSRGYRVDPEGTVRIERMPMGISAGLGVTIEDARLGELEQTFLIRKVKEKTLKLRVTGAGTVIVRLHAKGAPDQPLSVPFARLAEHECCGRTFDGPLSEIRWPTRPGLHPALRVGAKGFRERVLENIMVRHDGPTFLDVELEPR